MLRLLIRTQIRRCSESTTVLYGDQKWNSKEVIDKLDRAEFGPELAEKVAEKINDGNYIGTNHHSGYCGWALGKDKLSGVYSLCRNEGGDVITYIFEGKDGRNFVADMEWKEKPRFVEWLSEQSDFSMSGANTESDIGQIIKGNKYLINNQTITRTTLSNFIEKE